MKTALLLSFSMLLGLSLASSAVAAPEKPKGCDPVVPSEELIPVEMIRSFSHECTRAGAITDMQLRCDDLILQKPEDQRRFYICGQNYGIPGDCRRKVYFKKELSHEEVVARTCQRLTGCIPMAMRESRPSDGIEWIQQVRATLGCE